MLTKDPKQRLAAMAALKEDWFSVNAPSKPLDMKKINKLAKF